VIRSIPTLEQAIKAVETVVTDRLDDIEANRAYYEGDHWQDGKGYVGPRPQPGDTSYSTVMGEIERGFVAQNAVAEVTDRHTNGVLARAAQWSFTPRRPMAAGEQPTAEESALAAEAEAALTTWMQEAELPARVRQAAVAAILHSRGALRLFVPPAERNDAGIIEQADLAASLRRIHVEHPWPEQATVIKERYSQQPLSIYIWRESEDAFGEAAVTGERNAELSYVDDAGNTVIRLIRRDQAAPADFALPLGGRLILHELRRPALVTAPVRSQQRLLNLAWTMLQRNVVLGGFLERTLLNAQLPGRYIDEGGIQRFVPEPINVGAGAINTLVGVSTRDREGNENLSTPGIVYRDPVPVTTFSDTIDKAYLAILQETHQLHYAIAGDAASSGEARRQAMADYVLDLAATADQVEGALRWVLETALAMASQFAGTPGRFEGLRVSAQAAIEAGPMTNDDQRVIIDLMREGRLSWRTGLLALGYEDADAEIARVQEEMAEATNTAQLDEIMLQIDRGRSRQAQNAPAA
jgi:hypothetical protein